MRVPTLLAIVLLLAGAAGAGCLKARAQAPAPPPALNVPEPPDRVIIPAAPLPEPVETPPPAPPPSSARPSTTPPSRPAERPAPAAPPASTPPETTPATPPQVLQTTTTPGDPERTRAQINAAQRDLDRVNTKQLNANGRAQYDSAKGFIRLANEALNIKNYLLARELADKAASLARELARN